MESIQWIGNISRSEPARFLSDPRCQHFSCDLAKADALAATASEVIAAARARSDGPILLLNNSGFGSYGAFQDLEPAEETTMIDLNVRAMVDLTARSLPLLRERGGWIVNIASVAAYQPTPYMATYGATKAFVRNWTLALRQDLRETGVTALVVSPGPTESNFFQRAGFSSAPLPGRGQTAEEVVEATLAALRRGQSSLVSGWRNQLMVAGAGLLPPSWQAPLARVVLKHFRLDRIKASS